MALEVFNTLRIRSEEMVQDALEFLIGKFKQNRRLFTVSSVYGQLLYVQSQLAQLIFYYIEDSITELNIHESTRNSSKYSIAAIGGHNPTRAMTATGEIRIKPKDDIEISIPSNTVIIPNYSRINCLNNNRGYVMVLPDDDVRIPTTQDNEMNIVLNQGRMEAQVFTGKGFEFESIVVNFARNYFIDNFLVDVYVNDSKWTKYDNLLRMPRGENSCMVRTGVTSGVDVFFGNDKFGKYPNIGDEIRVEYLITDGFSGRVSVNEKENVRFEFIDTGYTTLGEEVDLNEIFEIETNIVPDFGANPEPVELTVQMLNREMSPLIQLDNYETLLKRLDYFSIIKVSQDPNDERMVNLFLVPDIAKTLTTTQTYFTIPLSDFLLSESKKEHLLKTIEKMGTKLIATDARILDPLLSKYVLNVALVVYDGYDTNIIKNDVVNAMSDYFLTINRKDRIPRSDLIRIIEDISGVDSVNVNIIGENNESAKILDPNAAEVGLDEFNDIIIKSDELPVIRGGWQDRNGNIYSEGLSDDGFGALNIRISDIIKKPSDS